MAKNRRLSRKQQEMFNEYEQVELKRILLNSYVCDSHGKLCKVIAINKRSITVKQGTDGATQNYKIYNNFTKRNLYLVNSNKQAELLNVLKLYEARIVIESPSTVARNTSNSNRTIADNKNCAPQKKSSDTSFKDFDVLGNVQHVCFVEGVDDEECLAHLRYYFPNNKDATLEDLFRGYQADCLRECSKFLGVGMETLMLSKGERTRWLFRMCSKENGWQCQYNSGDVREGVEMKRTLILACPKIKNRLFIRVSYNARSSQCNSIFYGFYKADEQANGVAFTHTFVCGPIGEVLNPLNHWFAEKAYYTARSLENASASTQQSSLATQKRESNNVKQTSKPIHVNDFLVRKTSGHRRKGHTLEPVRATVSIMPKAGGDMKPVEFNADWCPKCRKYFMTEDTYIRLKRQGYICCKVIEEKDIGTKAAGDGFYGKLASESILHMYGYNVNQKENLSRDERQAIIAFVIENKVQTAREIAVLLEWLISQRENMPTMRVAVQRWREDLQFVRYYRTPKRRVQVDRIYAKI